MFNTEQFELGDKVAVVTGGTEGIGRAIAEILGRAGAKVVVTSRRADAVKATADAFLAQGIEALGVATDVRDPEAVANLVSVAAESFGGIDILVNTAGGSFGDTFGRGPLLELSPKDFLESYRLNVVGAYLCAAAAVPIMRQGGGGAIVNISSLASHDPAQGMATYGASKAALNNLRGRADREMSL